MKRIAIALGVALSMLAPATVFANCFGSAALQTCTDASGNSYTVNRMGNMTTVQGYNAQTGSSWNQTSNTIGNSTYINGNAANGASWNESITNLGNGNRSISGTDSSGNSFSRYCTTYGCN